MLRGAVGGRLMRLRGVCVWVVGGGPLLIATQLPHLQLPSPSLPDLLAETFQWVLAKIPGWTAWARRRWTIRRNGNRVRPKVLTNENKNLETGNCTNEWLVISSIDGLTSRKLPVHTIGTPFRYLLLGTPHEMAVPVMARQNYRNRA